MAGGTPPQRKDMRVTRIAIIGGGPGGDEAALVAAQLGAQGTRVELAGQRGNTHLVRAGEREIEADVVLLATGATPRILPGALPDGERILTWRHVYDLDELPEHLVIVGSGVTGAEFASAYQCMGVPV